MFILDKVPKIRQRQSDALSVKEQTPRSGPQSGRRGREYAANDSSTLSSGPMDVYGRSRCRKPRSKR